MNYKLKENWGGTFDDQAMKAKVVSANRKQTVEFEFNGITCLVTQDTDLKLLLRDYMNAFTMDWKTVGPICKKKYDKETQDELSKKTKEKEEKQAQREREWREEERKERLVFEEKVKGIEIELKDAAQWETFKSKNTDPYGACCVEYAEGWAKLMQVEFKNGKKIAECAEPTSYELGFLGITGFMYGCAVSMLAQCWEHGEALRMWHNLKSQIGHEGEKANESGGVLNPAIITLG